MDNRQLIRRRRGGGHQQPTGSQHDGVLTHRRQFERQWHTTWFLASFYAHDLKLDLETLDDRHFDHEWHRRAEWVISFTTGKPIWPIGPMNTLARIVVKEVVGNVGYSRLVLSAFGMLGREVGIEIDQGALVLCVPQSDAVEAIPEPEDRPPVYADVVTLRSLDQFVTPFLECAPVSAFRVGDFQTLGLPSGSVNTWLGDTLVPGLHPPTLCQLCDRVRLRLPTPDCLTYSDKVALFLIHRRI